MIKPFARQLFTAAVLSATAAGAQASFTINLSFSGLSPTQESYFTAAKSFWEGIITGYQVGTTLQGSTLSGFSIAAAGKFIDGVGGTLGSAGPTAEVYSANKTFFYTTAGSMTFDTADIDAMIANGSFTSVIEHEMAHVIGFGTLWTPNGDYVTGTGHYTGANALSAYRSEFNQPAASFVPVELTGGSGTANGHWAERTGGTGPTGIVDRQGRDMEYELMTGWLNAPTFVSRTTIASFQDIGYTVAMAAIPEPGTYALLFAGLGIVGLVARRRKA